MKFFASRFCAALLVLAGLLSLCGCNGEGFWGELFGGGRTKPPVWTPPREELEPAPAPFPVTIDGAVIERSPAAIVCLSPALTEILCEFGEQSRIVGVSEYCDYPANIRETAEPVGSGAEFDADVILRIAPDLLLLPSPIADKDRIALERQGIVTLVISAPKSVDEFREAYKLIGVILRGGFTGEEEGEAAFAEINRACNNPGAVNIGKFIYVTENLLIATGDTLESSVLSCFGENLARDSRGYEFDKPLLLIEEPDLIILNSAYTLRDLEDDPLFSQLEAVQSGRVILVDNRYFERPSGRMTELIDRVLIAFAGVSPLPPA